MKEIKGDKQPIGKYEYRKPFTTHNISSPTPPLPIREGAQTHKEGSTDIGGASFSLPNGDGRGGTVFYLFTDGLPDQFGGLKGKKFMYKRFEENLSAICHLPLQEQKEAVEKSLQEWKGELEQVDDVTVIGIRI